MERWVAVTIPGEGGKADLKAWLNMAHARDIARVGEMTIVSFGEPTEIARMSMVQQGMGAQQSQESVDNRPYQIIVREDVPHLLDDAPKPTRVTIRAMGDGDVAMRNIAKIVGNQAAALKGRDITIILEDAKGRRVEADVPSEPAKEVATAAPIEEAKPLPDQAVSAAVEPAKEAAEQTREEGVPFPDKPPVTA